MCNTTARLTGQGSGSGVKVRVDRPSWDSIFNKYPKNAAEDAKYYNETKIYREGYTVSEISAIRMSIAFTGNDMMKNRLNNAEVSNENNVIELHDTHPLQVKKIIKDVLDLKKTWENWRCDDVFIYHKTQGTEHVTHIKNQKKYTIKGTSFVGNLKKNIIGNRKGIILINHKCSQSLVALWDGEKLVGGYYIDVWLGNPISNLNISPTDIYFWELQPLKIITTHETTGFNAEITEVRRTIMGKNEFMFKGNLNSGGNTNAFEINVKEDKKEQKVTKEIIINGDGRFELITKGLTSRENITECTFGILGELGGEGKIFGVKGSFFNKASTTIFIGATVLNIWDHCEQREYTDAAFTLVFGGVQWWIGGKLTLGLTAALSAVAGVASVPSVPLTIASSVIVASIFIAVEYYGSDYVDRIFDKNKLLCTKPNEKYTKPPPPPLPQTLPPFYLRKDGSGVLV